MSKLYDDVMADVARIAPPPWIKVKSVDPTKKRTVKSLLSGATVFDITNVSDYYYNGTDKEWFDPRVDFGCVRAPFSHFWMEAQRPEAMKSEANVSVSDAEIRTLPRRVGILGRVMDMGQPEIREFSRTKIGRQGNLYAQSVGAYERGECVVETIGENIMAAAEILQLTSFVERDKQLVGPMAHMFFWVREDGSVIDQVTDCEMQKGREPEHIEKARFEHYAYPALMAIDMMHARNARIVDVVAPQKLNRAHQRKHGQPLVQFKTVTILPFTERKLLTEKQVWEGTGSRAATIVPGHFAHYGIAGPGGWVRGKLFGKVSGRFWIPEHAAGSEDAGVIVKEYVMSKPDLEVA